MSSEFKTKRVHETVARHLLSEEADPLLIAAALSNSCLMKNPTLTLRGKELFISTVDVLSGAPIFSYQTLPEDLAAVMTEVLDKASLGEITVEIPCKYLVETVAEDYWEFRSVAELVEEIERGKVGDETGKT